MKQLKFIIRIICASGLVVCLAQSNSQAEAVHEFITSCAYGALAGSVIGAATLAFSPDPGQDLNAVARGASLGLYAGIALGLYVIYDVPSQNSEQASLRFWVQPMLSPNLKVDGFKAEWKVAQF